jgi:hypothetical protein
MVGGLRNKLIGFLSSNPLTVYVDIMPTKASMALWSAEKLAAFREQGRINRLHGWHHNLTKEQWDLAHPKKAPTTARRRKPIFETMLPPMRQRPI